MKKENLQLSIQYFPKLSTQYFPKNQWSTTAFDLPFLALGISYISAHQERLHSILDIFVYIYINIYVPV